MAWKPHVALISTFDGPRAPSIRQAFWITTVSLPFLQTEFSVFVSSQIYKNSSCTSDG